MGQGWGPRQLGASVPGALLAWDGACSTEDVFVMCSSPTIMLAGSQGVENRRSVFFFPPLGGELMEGSKSCLTGLSSPLLDGEITPPHLVEERVGERVNFQSHDGPW